MPDTKWRFVGTIDTTGDDAQHITQGIGYPLRPVDGVPASGGGELIDELPIASARPMHWAAPYQPGLLYLEGYVTVDDGWQMIANKHTLDRPAPVPAGNGAWQFGDTPSWTAQQDSAVVYSGHVYEFTVGGWINGLRVWVPNLSGTTNYRIVIINETDPDLPIYSTIEEPVLTAGDWTIISTFKQIVVPGSKVTIYLDALDSGEDDTWQAGYDYHGQQNNVNPVLAGWNHNQQQSEVRINKTDLDSTNMETQLLGVVPGSNLLFAETLDTSKSFNYFTTGEPVDMGDSVAFPVNLVDTGPGGTPTEDQPCSLNATIPIPLDTQYVELVGGVPTPSWGTVTGFKAYDGADQGGDANGYGIDLFFDEAIVSEDWDYMSYSEA